jgi:hypothetical protein
MITSSQHTVRKKNGARDIPSAVLYFIRRGASGGSTRYSSARRKFSGSNALPR